MEEGRLDYIIINVIGPSVLRAPAEQTKVATVLGNWSERRCADGV